MTNEKNCFELYNNDETRTLVKLKFKDEYGYNNWLEQFKKISEKNNLKNDAI